MSVANAIALNSIAFNISRTRGPVIAGVLVLDPPPFEGESDGGSSKSTFKGHDSRGNEVATKSKNSKTTKEKKLLNSTLHFFSNKSSATCCSGKHGY